MSASPINLDGLDARQKRDLLARLRRERAAERKSYPLTFSQERLWTLERIEQGARGHIMSAALRLDGALDVDALRRAQNEVVNRHAILRARFIEEDGRGRQSIEPTLEIPLPLEAIDEADLQALAAELANRPFDLNRGGLLRSTLFRLGEDRHVWVFAAHHIVFDGWSVGILAREIAAIYAAFVRGEPSPMAPLPLAYTDFAQQQRDPRNQARLQTQLEYWKTQLAGAPSAIELPIDRPRPPIRNEEGAAYSFRLPAGVSAAVKRAARESGVTLYMALLAAFTVLLRRHGAQPDMVIGTPVANRSSKEAEALIGFFVSSLPLRIDLSGDPTFSELLARVKQTAVGAFARQELPFERLVEELKIERDLSRNPVFQVMFGLRNIDTSLDLPGLRIEPFHLERSASQFDLTLLMKDAGDRIEGVFEYSTELFEPVTITHFARRLERLLTSATAAPDLPIRKLDLLTDAERTPPTAHTPSTFQPVTRAIRATVARSPEAFAVIQGERSWSYADLRDHADRVRAALAAQGAGSGSVVGIYLPRSLEMTAAILGTLESGAAYLPLDPQYPEERLQYIARDAGMTHVLTQSATPTPFQATVIATDQLSPAAAGMPESPHPEQPAYLIYTSGSTGKPKGVVVTHQNLSHFCSAARDAYPIQSGDRVLQFASLSFDAAVEEIFPCWSAGAALILRSEEMIATPAAFVAECERLGVTVLDLPTSYWRRLADALSRGQIRIPPSVRLTIIGGEAASRDTVRQWIDNGGGELLNTYGPTETTVVATFDRLSIPTIEAGRDTPIGRPLGQASAHILDSDLERVPGGVAGELTIGGPGVAQGYLGRPAQAALAFRPDPFSRQPGARLYFTGDRVRTRTDGRIEFLGRNDTQVKLRGFRIELGEVEAALEAHPDVREAAARVSASERLTAVVTGQGIDTAALRQWLKQRLPHYMLPAAIAVADALPRLPGGKIDRARLPEPAASQSSAQGRPLSDLESRLAAIWQLVIGVSTVGPHDNFFELGGDSIMSIQVASRAAQQGLALSSRDLFENQTIGELASAIATRETVATHEETAERAALSPIQSWFFERPLPNQNQFNQSVLLELEPNVDAALLQAAVEKVIARHDAFRIRFRDDEQRLSPESGSVWTSTTGADAPALQESLDIQQGPVFRIALLRDAGRADRLLLIGHHLVVDGVSWRTILEEIAHTYAGRELPPPPPSFLLWPRRMERHAAGSDSAPWIERARGARPLPLDIPGDDKANTVARSARAAVELTVTETDELLREALARLDARIDDVLLAALAVAFRNWTGASGLLVDLESHGRRNPVDQLDFSTTIGWFTSLYSVWLPADPAGPEPTLRQAQQTLRAIDDGGLSYGALRYLAPDPATRRKLQALPRAEVAFNYLGRLDAALAPPYARLLSETIGAAHHPDEPRSHLVEVNGMVRDGRLRFEWIFGEAFHRASTIERLAADHMESIRALICGERPAPAPAAGINRRNLAKLRKKLGASRG